MERNIVGWIEVPVADMERAMQFYQTVMDMELDRNQMGDADMAWFPYLEEKPGSPGSLVQHDDYKPSQDGVMIYFTAHSGDLANELGRVEEAGGKILKPKFEIPGGEHGFMAVIMDTEGNRIALHSMK